MKILRGIEVFAILLICFISFSNVHSASDSTPNDDYTIMIYLNGSDLEGDNSEATDTLNVLLGSKFDDDKINIIAITGGTKKWHMKNPVISNKQCQAWRIHGDPKKKMELVRETDPSMKMMDKNTLTNYIKWTLEEYPAKKYVLLFWDHGAGPIGGFGSDELDNNKSISISDIQEALKKSLGTRKLELLIFGCCLMGNMETAYKMKDYAKYMVGSEELEYGDFDKDFIGKLDDNPAMDGAKLGKIYIDSQFKNYEEGRFYTFSLIDLSKIEQIKTDWDGMIKELTLKLSEKHDTAGYYAYRFLAIARAYAESYDSFSRDSNGLVDMYDLAMNIELICKINTDKLRRSISDAVLYQKNGARFNSHGLSILFIDRKLEASLDLEDNLQKYRLSCFSKSYYDFLSDYYDKLYVKDPTSLIGSITFIQKEIILSNKGSLTKCSVKIDKADATLVNQIFFVIGKSEAKSTEFKSSIVDKDVSIDEEGNIAANISKNQYCIDEKPIPIYWEGNMLRPLKKGESPLGSFAVKHEGEVKFLLVKESINNKDSSKNIAEIAGMWSSKDYNGNIIPSLGSLGKPPKKGDKITILYKVPDKYVDGPEVKLDSYVIAKSAIEDGTYSGAFFIEDVIGRKMWSNFQNFKVDETGIKAIRTDGNSISMSDSQKL